jgi:hypothetical protein
MALATALGWLNTRFILSLLFFAVITPTAVIMRLFRDPLDRGLRNGHASYWLRKGPRTSDPKAYEQQY